MSKMQVMGPVQNFETVSGGHKSRYCIVESGQDQEDYKEPRYKR